MVLCEFFHIRENDVLIQASRERRSHVLVERRQPNDAVDINALKVDLDVNVHVLGRIFGHVPAGEKEVGRDGER